MNDQPDSQDPRFNIFVGSEWRKCGLNSFELMVFCNLKSHENSQSKLCCPSIRTIAKETELSRPTVIQALRGLETKGFMRHIEQTKADGSKASHRYVDLRHPGAGGAQTPVNTVDQGVVNVDDQGVVNTVDQGGQGGLPGVVNEVDHKDINLKGEPIKGEPTLEGSLSLQSERESPRERENPWGVDLEEGATEKNGEEKTSLRSGEKSRSAPKSSLRSKSETPKTPSNLSPSEQGNGQRPEGLPPKGQGNGSQARSAGNVAHAKPNASHNVAHPTNGAASRVNSAVQRCECEWSDEHPKGMPSLGQMYEEKCKEWAPQDKDDIRRIVAWVWELHDHWMATGFIMDGRPIYHWQSALHGWSRIKNNK